MSLWGKCKFIIQSNKVLSINLFGVIVLKGVSLILSFVMTPMYLGYFQDQNILGIWYTLQSVLMWILTFDLGLGNGIRNKLAYDIEAGKQNAARETISSGYIILAVTTAILLVLLLLVGPIINWQHVLNTDIENVILSRVLLITLIGIVLQFFFKVVTSVMMALRKNILANSLPIFTNIMILAFLLTTYAGDDDEKFVRLAWVYSIATLLPLVITTIGVFMGPLKEMRPSLSWWNKETAKKVVSVGGCFFAIQLGLLIINSTNQFLINYLYSGNDVVEYTLYNRLYWMAPMLFTLFTQPIWSEVSVHYAHNDMLWIKRLFRILLSIAGVFMIGCLIVTGMLPVIFRVWIGCDGSIVANKSLGFVFAVWGSIEVFIYASTCIANGMTELKCQTIFTIIAAVAKLPVTLLCSHWIDSWISVLIAHIVVILPLMIAQIISLNRKLQGSKPLRN